MGEEQVYGDGAGGEDAGRRRVRPHWAAGREVGSGKIDIPSFPPSLFPSSHLSLSSSLPSSGMYASHPSLPSSLPPSLPPSSRRST